MQPAESSVRTSDPNQRASMGNVFRPFRNRHFRWQWVSTFASFAGMQMQTIALGVLGWQLSGSYYVVGILMAANAIPMALLSLPGGALVDRLEKRRVVIFSQFMLGVVAGATAVLVQTDQITLVFLFLGSVIQGAMFSLNGPARTALVTEIVSSEDLGGAISLQTIAMNSTRVIGPAVAGMMISFVSIEGTYYVTASMYLLAVVTTLRVPKGSAHIGRAASPLLADMTAGMRYVWNERMLRSLCLSGLALALFVWPYQVMLPGFADTMGHAALFGVMVAISGVGGVAGSFAVATIANHPRKPYFQFMLGLFAAASLVALGALTGPLGAPAAFIALACVGAGATGYMTLNQTMLMTEAQPAYRGRVMSMNMLSFSAMPLMALPLGLLADAVGGGAAFVAQGIIAAGAIVLLGLTNREHTFRSTESHAVSTIREPLAGNR